jgi:hypothetical protein
MARDVYTADMGQPPVNDDMGSIEDKRGQLRRPVGGMPRRPMAAPMAPKRRMADPADAGIYTADKGQPPSPDEGPTMMRRRPGMKKGGCVKKMASGGKVGSASKRADGCATKGKTKGRFV